jgi:pentatricopeptide repeat protein
MQAYANSSDMAAAAAAEKAEGILSEMKGFASSGNDQARPDAFSYATVMAAQSRAGNPHRAEELLEEMKNDASLKPTVVPYTSVIQAYVNSSMDADGAIAKVGGLLEEMWELSAAGDTDVKPNGGTYTAALQLFSKGFDDETTAGMAEALLERMVDEGIKPGGKAFAAVLDALAEVGNDEATARVVAMRERVYGDGPSVLVGAESA